MLVKLKAFFDNLRKKILIMLWDDDKMDVIDVSLICINPYFTHWVKLISTCCCEAFEYPPWTIGVAKWLIKSGKVPSFPGNTKSNKDHNSFKLFWIGDPDRIILCAVFIWN